jgi:hypothetical protein
MSAEEIVNSKTEEIIDESANTEENLTENFAESTVEVKEEFVEYVPLNYYPGYSISKPNGPNWIIRKDSTGNIISQCKNSSGYLGCNITNKYGVRKTEFIHRIVGRQFLDFEPEGKDKGMVVDHRNNNKLDNSIENLQIITASENIRKNHPHTHTIKYIDKLPEGKQFKLISVDGVDIEIEYIRIGNDVFRKMSDNKFLHLAFHKNSVQIKINYDTKPFFITINSPRLKVEQIPEQK